MAALRSCYLLAFTHHALRTTLCISQKHKTTAVAGVSGKRTKKHQRKVGQLGAAPVCHACLVPHVCSLYRTFCV